MSRVFRFRGSTVHERFGDESVIVNLDTGSYYSAQGTAETIWIMVADGASELQIVHRMKSEFSGPAETIERLTMEFLDHLVGEELVDPTEGADDQDAAGVVSPASAEAFVAPSLQKYVDMEELLRLDPIHEVDEAGWPSTRKQIA